jgi:hypothetical protein
MPLKIALTLFILTACVLRWRRRRDLPLAVFVLLASAFLSRVYWRVHGTTIRLESLACLFLFAVLVFDFWKKRAPLRLDIRGALVPALFPVMVLSSALVARFPLASLKKTMVYVPYLLGFLALTHYLADPERRARAWDFFYQAGAAAMAVSVAGFYLYRLGFDLGMVRAQWGTLWLRGTLVTPNILGSTGVIIMVLALKRLTSRAETRPESRRDGAVLVAAASAVLLSMTRTAWICGGLTVLLGLAWALWGRRARAALAVVTLVGLAVGLNTIVGSRPESVSPAVVSRESSGEFGEPDLDVGARQQSADRINFSAKISGGFANDTLTRRLQTIRLAVQDWELSPWLGRGTDSFLIEHDNASDHYISSTWVAVLHDWGAVSLALHLAFLALVGLGLVTTCRRSGRLFERQGAASLLAVLVLTTVMYQISTTLQLSLFWILLAWYWAFSGPLRPAFPRGPGEASPAQASGN